MQFPNLNSKERKGKPYYLGPSFKCQSIVDTSTHLAKIMEQTENLSVKIQDILSIKEQMENSKLKIKNRYRVLDHDKLILS